MKVVWGCRESLDWQVCGFLVPKNLVVYSYILYEDLVVSMLNMKNDF